ncbi:MAG TPA: hypothetical protein VH278_01310 [Burkholderiaceae bacterium]|jgi:hypothetical protein|nr:hypothetical protein [Burkholderiaceae bacterium]
MKQFQFHAFERQKNDVFFAFVMAAVFAITVVGAVAGAFDVARGHAGADMAKARGQAVAMRDPGREPLNVPSGARK